jgi:hypothetical protein
MDIEIQWGTWCECSMRKLNLDDNPLYDDFPSQYMWMKSGSLFQKSSYIDVLFLGRNCRLVHYRTNIISYWSKTVMRLCPLAKPATLCRTKWKFFIWRKNRHVSHCWNHYCSDKKLPLSKRRQYCMTCECHKRIVIDSTTLYLQSAA